MTRIYALLGSAVVLSGLAIGGWLAVSSRSGDPFADCRIGAVAGGGNLGGPFTLTDQHGRSVTDSQVIDGLALVYFGYTYCPDICPLDTARNIETAAALKERGIALKPVFISIDPARDTPQALTDFAEYIGPGLVALTGTEAQISQVAKSYGVYFARNGADEDYLMDHSVQSYLMHPVHGFLEFFPREIRSGQMVETIACFADKL